MTDPTDDDIEALAADWLRGRGPHDVPDSLRARVRAVGHVPVPRRARPTWLLLAASLAALVALGTLGVAGALLLGQPAPKPSIPPAVSPSPLASPLPSAAPSASLERSLDPSSDVPSIQFADLVDSSHGWVVGRDTFAATADGGSTWATTDLPGPRVGRGVLGAAFADLNHGWLATLDSNDLSSRVFDVWRTSNGGRTWQKAVLEEGVVSSDTMGNAHFSVVGPDHLFVWIEGGMPSGWTSDLYESADGGATWSHPRTSPEGVSGPATFVDAAHGVVVGGARGYDLFSTSDGGASWHSIPYPLPKGADRQLTTFLGPARFFDDRDGAISAIYSTPDLIPQLLILSTADAGETWSIAATDNNQGWPVAFVNATNWLEVVGATVRETTDAGATWSERSMAGSPGFIAVVSMPDEKNGWAIADDPACPSSGCTARLLVGTTDGWRTLHTLTLPNGTARASASASPSPASTITPEAQFRALAFFDRDHGLIGGASVTGPDSGTDPRGVLRRTDDGGRTWTDAPFELGPIIALSAIPDGHAWAATGCADGECASDLLESADRGRTWIPVARRQLAALSFADADRGWALTPGGAPDPARLLGTTDGGRAWSALSQPCSRGSAVSVSFVSSNRGWVACASEAGAGQEPKAIVETTDGGRTWALRSEAGPSGSVGRLFSSDYVTGISMRPSGAGLMWMGRGTTAATTDSGRTWRTIPPGDFDVVIPAGGVAVDERTWFLLLWNGNVSRNELEVSHDAGATWEVVTDLG